VNSRWKQEIEAAVAAEDWEALRRLARERVSTVLRCLVARLYSRDDGAKWRAVRALGEVAAEPSALSGQRAAELMRRFVWALNDESGNVPYGVPEAMGEILAVRPELQPAFLPILCSLLTQNQMSQTGPIERGAVWAVGRIGPAAARRSPEIVDALRRAAETHPDAAIRQAASRSLASITGGDPV